jgi:hypothetical protein
LRDQPYIAYQLPEMPIQRVFQIAFGYEGGNDSHQEQSYFAFKPCAGKLPGKMVNWTQSAMSRL